MSFKTLIIIAGMTLVSWTGFADNQSQEKPEPLIQCLTGDFLILVWEGTEEVTPVTITNIKDGTETGYVTEPSVGKSGMDYWIYRNLSLDPPFNLALVQDYKDANKIIGHIQAKTNAGEIVKSTSVVCTQ